jgi:TolA-binding protein
MPSQNPSFVPHSKFRYLLHNISRLLLILADFLKGFRFASMTTRFRFLSLYLLFALCSLPLIAQDTKENSDFKLAVNLYNDGMLDLATTQLKTFIDTYPSTSQGIEARWYLGLIQIKQKHFDEARFTFQNFALTYVDNPKAPDAWIKVAESYVALHNDLEAASAYERVKTFYPKNPIVPEALMNAARLYKKAGDLDHAKAMVRAITQDYPNSESVFPARVMLAESYLEDGQTDLAEQEARHVDGSDASAPVKADAEYLLGEIQYSMALFDEAEATFRGVVEQHPGTEGATKAAFQLGLILKANLKFKDAGEQFLAAASSAKDSLKARAYFYAGETAISDKSYAAAIKDFDEVIAENPSPTLTEEARYHRGVAELLSGDYRAAIDVFSKIDASGPLPLQPASLMKTAEAYVKLGQFNEAVSTYSSLLIRFPDNELAPQAGFALGTLYEDQLHDSRKAAAAFNDLTVKYSHADQAPPAALEAGKCEEQLEEYQNAARTYEFLINNYPSYKGNEDLQRHIRFLEDHNIQNRDEGMLKLSKLVGELLLDKPKQQISLELADVYFRDLKDYRAATAQYTNAIEKGLNEADFIDTYYDRARAYHLLSEIDSTAEDQAITYYEAYLKQFPTSKWSGACNYYAMMLKLKRKPMEETLARAKSMLASPLDPELKQNTLYLLATAGITDLTVAEHIGYARQLADEFPVSPLSQKALEFAGDWFAAHQLPDSALAYWSRAVKECPNGYYTSAILLELVDQYTKSKKYGEAIADAKSLVEQYAYTPESDIASTKLPALYLDDGKFAEAAAMLESSERGTPQTPGANDETEFYLAEAYNKQGNSEKAVPHYRKFLEEHAMSENAAQAYYALGVAAKADGKSDLATAYFKEAAKHGGVTGASQEIADLLFENEQYTEAARQYGQLEQNAQTPEDKRHFLSREIVATLRDDKVQAASGLIQRFTNSYPDQKEDQAEFLLETGMVHYRAQNYAAAKKEFEQLGGDFKETKFGPWGMYYQGKILEVTNVLDDAAKRYDEILHSYPSSTVIPHVLLSLGNMHFNAERYDEAIKYYQTIIDTPGVSDEVLTSAMNNLIQAYESTKLYDAALKIDKEFIEKFPNDESIIDKKIKLGTLYTKLAYYDQAVQYFQKLIEEAGSLLEAELRYDIGDAYYQKGDYEQAILEFLKVPYLVSRQGKVNWTATSLYMAGQAYEKMSKFDQAIAMYQQIVDRSGIDATFKSAARKEITRVKTITK